MIGKSDILLYAGVAAMLLAGVWYVDQRAFNRGQHSRDTEVAALTSQVAQAAVILTQCNDNAKAQADAAKAQRSMADAALKAATERDKNRTRDLTEAVNKLNAARQTADCKATSEAKLCDAMLAY